MALVDLLYWGCCRSSNCKKGNFCEAQYSRVCLYQKLWQKSSTRLDFAETPGLWHLHLMLLLPPHFHCLCLALTPSRSVCWVWFLDETLGILGWKGLLWQALLSPPTATVLLWDFRAQQGHQATKAGAPGESPRRPPSSQDPHPDSWLMHGILQ